MRIPLKSDFLYNWLLDMSYELFARNRLDEEDITIPSHVAKICHKSGRCQHYVASLSLLTNRTQGKVHMTPKNFVPKETFGSTSSTAAKYCIHHAP